MRTPVFELHIRPMFRATDREHMQHLFGEDFDLWNYDAVVEFADRILDSLEQSMPPDDTGGPWPVEWVLLFQRWRLAGFKRLELGKGTYEVLRTEDVADLVATFTLPAPGWSGWLQLESVSDTSRTYILYLEAPDDPEGGLAEEVTDSEQFDVPGLEKLFIHDKDGVKQLAIPQTPDGAG
ncbi:MAG TPA: hypothetical protein VFV09_10880 [Actinomycetota bacterium]|nr:hypothetical protein [Actinomycetota bacterium]